jgi:uncharacterized membrane protein
MRRSRTHRSPEEDQEGGMATQGGARQHGSVVSMEAERRRGDRPRGLSLLRSGDGGFDPERVANGLGWFSIGLGLAGVLAPAKLTRIIGLKGRGVSKVVARVVGVRELAAGIGILTEPRPARWVWSRVVGDVMDLAVLGIGFTGRRVRRGRLALATVAVAGVTVVDAVCAQQLTSLTRVSAGSPDGRTLRARKRVIIDRPADALYRFWRDFSNMPRFMERVESVQTLDERRSHWRVKAPGGITLQWDSQVTDDRPNEVIAWRSLEGSPVQHSGVVRFEPARGGRGTVVTVDMEYTPPGGAVTAAAAKLMGLTPEQQLQEDLRRFKQLMETGEVARSESALSGAGRPPQTGEPRGGTR